MDDISKRLEYGANLAVTALMYLRELDEDIQKLLAQTSDPLERLRLETELEMVQATVEGAAGRILQRYMEEEL